MWFVVKVVVKVIKNQWLNKRVISVLFIMAFLLFDNLSSKHVIGFWIPIKLKLTPSTIHYKSGMGKNAMFISVTLQQLHVDEGLSRVLVSCHSRELAFQISKNYEGVPLKNDIDSIKNGKLQIVLLVDC